MSYMCDDDNNNDAVLLLHKYKTRVCLLYVKIKKTFCTFVNKKKIGG